MSLGWKLAVFQSHADYIVESSWTDHMHAHMHTHCTSHTIEYHAYHTFNTSYTFKYSMHLHSPPWNTQNQLANWWRIHLIKYDPKSWLVFVRESVEQRANHSSPWGNTEATRREQKQVREWGERRGKGYPRVTTKLNQRYADNSFCVCVFLREYVECNKVEGPDTVTAFTLDPPTGTLLMLSSIFKKIVCMYQNYFYFKYNGCKRNLKFIRIGKIWHSRTIPD